MISIEEAREIVLRHLPAPATEEVALLDALERVLAEDLVAPWDVPCADNSAMDGYAFCHRALKGEALEVSGFLAAGGTHDAVSPGTAIKIMTGAPLPDGCDTVVPVEEAVQAGSQIRIPNGVREGSHVRRKGEDMRAGDVVIPAGTVLRPQEIGMLAALGRTALTVYRRTRVAVLATGDELLEPGSHPAPGKVINSNSYAVAAQVLEAGGEPELVGIARDTLEDTCVKIVTALDADVVVISGGVSVGDRDFVKEALEKLGAQLVFWKIDVKPGKPLAFALLQGKPVFALPGNPVAAMVSFELFVRPSLLKSMGHEDLCRATVRATLQEPVKNRGERPHLVRGVVSLQDSRYTVATTGNQSSARLSSLVQGNGLICLPSNASLEAGDEVEVMVLGELPHHEEGRVGCVAERPAPWNTKRR